MVMQLTQPLTEISIRGISCR